MAQPVTIENDAFRIDVWPQFGGKVSSCVDKADGYELLFNYPAELPDGPLYDQPYAKGWYAGWDECFPSVGASRYPGHPYDGIGVPDHGELWGLPTTSVPAKGGITTVWHGLRFGYRLTRRVTLDGPSLAAEYSLINLAPFDFKFVWAQHALLAMNQDVELALKEKPFRFSHDAGGTDIQRPFEWGGETGELASVRRPGSMPAGRGWKLFSTDPISAPATVSYPGRDRTLTIEYLPAGLTETEGPTPAYWGIWINTGGWAGHRHFAIEPTTGRYDPLDRAAADRSAGILPGSGRRDWAVRWTVGPA